MDRIDGSLHIGRAAPSKILCDALALLPSIHGGLALICSHRCVGRLARTIFFHTAKRLESGTQGPVCFEVILSLGLCGVIRPNTPRKAELMPRVASLRDISASAGLHENPTVRNVGRGGSNGQKRPDRESSVGGLLFGSVIISLIGGSHGEKQIGLL